MAPAGDWVSAVNGLQTKFTISLFHLAVRMSFVISTGKPAPSTIDAMASNLGL